MDEKWFKNQQRKVGVTADQIADHIGRHRSIVSRVYTGRQPMTLDLAKAFAEVLKVPLGTILEKAGVANPEVAQQVAPGFAESDATPWAQPARQDDANRVIATAMGGTRPGMHIWRVKGNGMLLGGYMPGDYMLLDTYAAERVQPGDAVIAQHYQPNGTAITVLRRYEPPVLVSSSADPADRRVLVVDGVNVVIMGKIIGSWRM